MSNAWTHTPGGVRRWRCETTNNTHGGRVMILLHWERMARGSLRLRLPNGGCIVKERA